jgi:hypothetical protein
MIAVVITAMNEKKSTLIVTVIHVVKEKNSTIKDAIVMTVMNEKNNVIVIQYVILFMIIKLKKQRMMTI